MHASTYGMHLHSMSRDFKIVFLKWILLYGAIGFQVDKYALSSDSSASTYETTRYKISRVQVPAYATLRMKSAPVEYFVIIAPRHVGC